MRTLLSCLLLLCCTAFAAAPWTLDLQKGAYGPFRLGMSVAEASQQARQCLKDPQITPTGSLCEIRGMSKDGKWSLNMMFQDDKAYDLMLGGAFPGQSGEGLSSKSLPGDYAKKLGPPSKSKEDKDFGTTTLIYLKPNIRVTYEKSGTQLKLVSLRFVPPGKRSTWD